MPSSLSRLVSPTFSRIIPNPVQNYPSTKISTAFTVRVVAVLLIRLTHIGVSIVWCTHVQCLSRAENKIISLQPQRFGFRNCIRASGTTCLGHLLREPGENSRGAPDRTVNMRWLFSHQRPASRRVDVRPRHPRSPDNLKHENARSCRLHLSHQANAAVSQGKVVASVDRLPPASSRPRAG